MTIAEFQKREGLTQPELARFLDVSERTIRYWRKNGEGKLVKLYLELMDSYINCLRKNKSFRVKKSGDGRVSIMVWGTTHYDYPGWVLWKQVPAEQARKMGLVEKTEKREKL